MEKRGEAVNMSLITLDLKTGKVLKITDCPDDKMTQAEANQKYNSFLAEVLYEKVMRERGKIANAGTTAKGNI